MVVILLSKNLRIFIVGTIKRADRKIGLVDQSAFQDSKFRIVQHDLLFTIIFFFKQKTAYEIGLGIPAEPLFRSKKPPRFGGMKTYNWEGVNPDGYFLDKLEPIPSALPSFQKLFQVSATALSIP